MSSDADSTVNDDDVTVIDGGMNLDVSNSSSPIGSNGDGSTDGESNANGDDAIKLPVGVGVEVANQYIVKSVSDMRIINKVVQFFTHWLDGTSDWRLFDELAERAEDGELEVAEGLAAFLEQRGLLDVDSFDCRLREDVKTFTFFAFRDTSSSLSIAKFAAWIASKVVGITGQTTARKTGSLASADKVWSGTGAGAGSGAGAIAAVGKRVLPSLVLSGAAHRRADSATSFRDELKKRPSIVKMLEEGHKMGLSNLFLTKLVLYQETRAHEKTAPFDNILNGTLPYLLVLDCIHDAFGSPVGSPLSLSLRARQVTGSQNYTNESTSNDLPIGLYFPQGITYAERESLVLRDRVAIAKIAHGIIDRASIGLTFIYDSVGTAKNAILLKLVEDFSVKFAGTRTDMLPSRFCINGNVDPSRTPKDIGDKARVLLAAYALNVAIKQTTLTNKDGVRFTFKGAFWNGASDLVVGTRLGYYEGRIITQCDYTELYPDSATSARYVLDITRFEIMVDADNIEDSNWTRYINDGVHGRTASDSCVNVMIADDGSITTTRAIKVGEEFFVSYGLNFWRNEEEFVASLTSSPKKRRKG